MLKLKRMLTKTAAIAATAVVAFGGLVGLQAAVPGGVQKANAYSNPCGYVYTDGIPVYYCANQITNPRYTYSYQTSYQPDCPSSSSIYDAIGYWTVGGSYGPTHGWYPRDTRPSGYPGYDYCEYNLYIAGTAHGATAEFEWENWGVLKGPTGRMCGSNGFGGGADPVVCGMNLGGSAFMYATSMPSREYRPPEYCTCYGTGCSCAPGGDTIVSPPSVSLPENPDFKPTDITQIPTVTSVDQFTNTTDPMKPYSIHASATGDNSGVNATPITATASGLPQGVTYTVTRDSGSDRRGVTVAFSGTAKKPGIYPVTVSFERANTTGRGTVSKFNIHVSDTTAPVIQPISDKALKTDSKITPGKNQVNIPFQITDNSGVYIVSSVTGLPKGLAWTKSGITGNIDPSETGKTFKVTVNAEDTIIPGHPTHEINKSSESFRITVVDGTEPDIGTTDFAGLTDRLEPQPGQVSREVSFELVTGDNSGINPDVSFSRPLPDGLKYDKFTKMITGRLEPHTFLQTPYRLTVTAKDTAGNVRNKLMTVTISDGTEPQITFTDQTANTGDNFSYTFPNVSDNSGNKPKVTLEGIPRGLGWNDVSYTLSGTILPELARNNGVNKMTVVSSDLAGNSTNPKVFTLKVIDTTPPEIPEIIKDEHGNPVVIDGLHVLNDDTTTEDVYTRQIVATDNSESDLKYDISGLPLGIGYDEDTGLISGMTKKPGVYPIDVKVTDPSGNTSVGARYHLTVLDKTLPSMVGDPQLTGETSVKNEVELQFSDNDGFPPSLELGQMPQNNATQNIATEVVYDPATGLTTLKVTVIARTPGVREFPVTVTDRAGNAYTDKVVINIVDTTPPTISGGPFKCETGKPCNKKINVNDNSGGKTTVSVDNPGQLPPGVTIDADGNITGSTDKPGEYHVDVTAKDESGNEAKAVVVIIVTDSTPPTVTIDGKDTRDANAEYTLEVGFPINPIRLETSDNSGEATRLEFGPLPDGLQSAPDRKGGTISGTPIKTGDYTTHATLSDPSGNITKFTILFHIIDTTAPKATGGEGSKTVNGYIQWTVEAGTDIELKINVKDNNPGVKPLVSLASGKLPDNTELSQDGVLKGKPRDIGVYNSIWRVADPAGNRTDIQVRVNVVDTTPPMIVMPKPLSLPACESMVNLTYPIQILDSARNGAVEVTNTTGAPDGLKYSHADFIKDRQFFGILGKKAKPGTVYHPEFTARDKAGNLATETGTIKIVACTPEEIEKALKNAPQVPDGLRDGYPNADISGGNNVGGNIGPRASAGTLAKTGVAITSLALVGAMAGLGVLAARKSKKQMK